MSSSDLIEPIQVVAVPNCYLCQTPGTPLYQDLEDRILEVPGKWTLMRCPECQLVWLNPCPREDQIPRLYARGYQTHAPGRDADAARRSALRILKNRFTEHLEHILFDDPSKLAPLERLSKKVLPAISPLIEAVRARTLWLDPSVKGRLLDVGCGAGEFLAQMRRLGWEVEGVEPDPLAVAHAMNRHGLKITCSTLESAAFPDDRFDIVTMSHVIEHVPDPVRLMAECRRILKGGGRLIVLTPNSQSLARRLFGVWWYHWDPPRHLLLFSPHHLASFGAKTGFDTSEVRTSARAARGSWHFSRILRRDQDLRADPPLPVWFRVEGALFWLLEYLLAKRYPLGEEILLIAIKGGLRPKDRRAAENGSLDLDETSRNLGANPDARVN